MKKFFQAFLPGIIKPLHALWNEMIGFLFAVFAIVIFASLVKGIMQYQGDTESLGRLLMMGFAFVVMAFFGIQSFWKARKISRS
jgi:type VI protein secretion system component VasK